MTGHTKESRIMIESNEDKVKVEPIVEIIIVSS